MKNWEKEIVSKIEIISKGGQCRLECGECPFTLSSYQCPSSDILIEKAKNWLVMHRPEE